MDQRVAALLPVVCGCIRSGEYFRTDRQGVVRVLEWEPRVCGSRCAQRALIGLCDVHVVVSEKECVDGSGAWRSVREQRSRRVEIEIEGRHLRWRTEHLRKRDRGTGIWKS